MAQWFGHVPGTSLGLRTAVENVNNVVLLTGAGFTKNFGGLLGAEIWAEVFNQVSKIRWLRGLMVDEMNFEIVYAETMNEGSESDQECIRNAVVSAFRRIDDQITPHNFNVNLAKNFLALFRDPQRASFWFTLNQDLWAERHYYRGDPTAVPVMPGVRALVNPTPSKIGLLGLDSERLPQSEVAEPDSGWSSQPISIDRGFYYMKLHGSYGWRSKDGCAGMVIGAAKQEEIDKIPILRRYSEVFRCALQTPDLEIWLCGYGFLDPHINAILADSVSKYRARIVILDPTPVRQLIERLRASRTLRKILDGVTYFYSISLADAFAEGGRGAHYCEILERHFEASRRSPQSCWGSVAPCFSEGECWRSMSRGRRRPPAA